MGYVPCSRWSRGRGGWGGVSEGIARHAVLLSCVKEDIYVLPRLHIFIYIHVHIYISPINVTSHINAQHGQGALF